MIEGWIKIHRKISNKAFYCKDSEKVHLWIHLLIKANRKDREEFFNGHPILCKPGQFTTGRKQLSKETGISESKIQRILTYFEKIEQQIEQQTSNTNRLISILNWCDYQVTEQQIEQQLNSERTTTEQQLNTLQEVKEYKEIKEYSNEIKNFTESILKYFPIPPKKIGNWYEITEKLIRLDNYDLNTIEIIVKYFRADSFWIDNFQSYTKLRKKKDEGLYIDYFKNILISKNNGSNQKISRTSNTTPEGLRAIIDQFPDY